MQEIITVKQLPIITERLQAIWQEIEPTINAALALDVTDENRKAVKKTLADLRKMFAEIDESRKGVKRKVMEPCKAMDSQFNLYIGDNFNNAIDRLQHKVDTIEDGLKMKTAFEVGQWAMEYAQSKGIDFYTFTGIVGLTDSIPKLRKIEKEKIDRMYEDIQAIASMQYAPEIKVEYLTSLSLSAAIAVINDRHEKIEKIKAERAEKEKAQKMIGGRDSGMSYHPQETLSAPAVKEKELTVSFKVTATESKLIQLKQYLKDNNIKYE